ncbi:uncharacterized protein LOC134850879 [Symsagittifera roscoffensis]|uniref:uncharacterized protein LOC134850879 n=1 Tax=Symsagittifera roscoffensis TaxID=84072 RepID=UPI00307B2B25
MLSARLSVSSENVNPVALLTSLLMHDYMLPKLMLKQAPNFNVSAGGSSETQASAQRRLFAAPYTSVTCQGVHCVSDICSLSNAFPIIDLVRPFVTVLNHVGFICPNALADSLLPIMNEHGDISNFLKGDPLKTTGWANIYLLLSPIVKELLQNSLLCLFETSAPPVSTTLPMYSAGSLGEQPFYQSLGELPCGCRLRNSRSNTNNYNSSSSPASPSFLTAAAAASASPSYSERVYECVSEYMRLLSTAIYSLSPALLAFFSQLDRLCMEEEAAGYSVPNHSLLLYVICRCTIHYIKNQNYMHDEVQIGALKKREMKLLKKFKDSLKNLFCSHEKSPNWTADQVNMYNVSRPQVEILGQKLNRFVKSGSSRAAGPGANAVDAEKNFADDVPISVLDDQVLNGCQLVWSTAEGRISLVQAHHIIKANLSWIEHELHVSSLNRTNIPSPSAGQQEQQTRTAAFQPASSKSAMNSTDSNTTEFQIPSAPVCGPLTCNSGKIHSLESLNQQLDWDNLFCVDLGISKLALKKLIVNRPEFQDESMLLTGMAECFESEQSVSKNETMTDSDLVEDSFQKEYSKMETNFEVDIANQRLQNEQSVAQQRKIMINEIREALHL